MTGVVMGIVIIVTVTGTVVETVIAMGKGTVIVIATEIAMVTVETVTEVIGTERDGQTEMRGIGQGLIKKALPFLMPPNVRKVDGTIRASV